MKLIEVEKKEIRQRSKIVDVVLEFYESGMECALVADYTTVQTPNIGANCLNRCARRVGILNVHAFVSGGKVYLMRTGE